MEDTNTLTQNTTPFVQEGSTPPPPQLPPNFIPEPPISTVDNTFGENTPPKRGLSPFLILAPVLLIGLAVLGFFFLRPKPNTSFDCTKYSFSVSQPGVVIVNNNSSTTTSAQKAQVYVDDQMLMVFDVSQISPGGTSTLGSLPISDKSGFKWKVTGTLACSNEGRYAPATLSLQCQNILAYDKDWNLLTPEVLSSLHSGDLVYFTVNGLASTGSIDKAKFTVNGVARPEVTTLKPNSTTEFYDQYTVPTDTTTFTIGAQLHNKEQNIWF